MTRQGFALFDFDGTLAKGDSIVPFSLYAVRKGFAPLLYVSRLAQAVFGYALHIYSDAQAKERALSFLRGKSVKEVRDFSESFFREILRPRIYPDARREIERCKAEGLRVLVVTASPEVYLQPLLEELGVDDIIGTRVDVTPEGIYSGLLSGNNCKGLEKPLRIAEYLAAKGYVLDTASSWAYGDTASDLPMMNLTGHPVAVNAREKLRKTAGTDVQHVSWRLSKRENAKE